MFDYFFFDLDGTLTDPAEGITNSFIYALKYFGLPLPDYQTLCTFIGPPLPDTFKNEFHFTDEETNLAVQKYREYFSQKGLFENKIYPGIKNLLEKLKEEGKTLVVATSKPEEYSKKILEHFDLASYFDLICGSLMDESRSKKEEVISYAISSFSITDLRKVLMIGDRKYDILGAHANNIKACGVLYGYGKRLEFIESKADYICENISQLEELCLKN